MASAGLAVRMALLSLLAAYTVPAVYRYVNVFGYLRAVESSHVSENDFIVIEDTTFCEDLHQSGDWLFTACEDSATRRFHWFPPLVNIDDPSLANEALGSLHVIDPKTLKSKRLQLQDFGGPFVTHGIDVISDPKQDDAVYIFAVNHVPDAEYLAFKKENKDNEAPKDILKAHSQIEVFHHVLGSSTAKWLRSIWDPLIKTPNDIVAASPSSIYVTNDHYYREGPMRLIEDEYFGTKWSDIVRVQINDFDNAKNASAGISASIALTGLHNNNGLGRGRTAEEIAIGCAGNGELHLGQWSDKDVENPIRLTDSISLDSAIDNPVYYKDPYATNKNDASGFVLGGLSHAKDLGKTRQDPNARDPVIVWFVQPAERVGKKVTKWSKTALFKDDGSRIRTSSVALLLPIDPASEGGRKKAWLLVSGFLSKNMVAVKVDLPSVEWDGQAGDEL